MRTDLVEDGVPIGLLEADEVVQDLAEGRRHVAQVAVQAVAHGQHGERGVAHRRRAQIRQVGRTVAPVVVKVEARHQIICRQSKPFPFLVVVATKRNRTDRQRTEHGVAEELESLVAVGEPVGEVGRMAQRLHEQRLVGERVVQLPFQVVQADAQLFQQRPVVVDLVDQRNGCTNEKKRKEKPTKSWVPRSGRSRAAAAGCADCERRRGPERYSGRATGGSARRRPRPTPPGRRR